MIKTSSNASRVLICFCVFLVPLAALIVPGWAQETHPKPKQIDGVDNTRMGAYRALAQLAFEAFRKGDTPGAAKLALVLDRVWNRGEEQGGENALSKTQPKLFQEIDNAMDDFAKPLIFYESKAPNPASLEGAYNAYMDMLKKGD